MFKNIICFLIFVLFCIPFSVCAESNASAFLTDVSAEKNKLFKTTLSVNSEVSAFVATLTFDENKVEFRSAEALSENSQISINNDENDKVIIAFLNKYGTQGEVLSFTFKATGADARIDLGIEQVIGVNAEDIMLSNVKGANVTIASDTAGKSESKNPEEQTKEAETSATALNKDKETLNLNIPAKENSDISKTVIISSGAVLLISVGATGFILGRKSDNKNRKNQYEKNS